MYIFIPLQVGFFLHLHRNMYNVYCRFYKIIRRISMKIENYSNNNLFLPNFQYTIMALSRIHTSMLAVVALFTGMISPLVTHGDDAYSLFMTDIQMLAYGVLILLAGIFLCSSLEAWRSMKIISVSSLIVILYFFIATWNRLIHTNNGDITNGISWGWIFIIAGSVLLIWSMIDDTKKSAKSNILDQMVGWL